MAKTKKVKAAGKFGARYGRRIRQNILKVGVQKRHRCPECMKLSLRREVSGIWKCSKCGAKIAGKAYRPQ